MAVRYFIDDEQDLLVGEVTGELNDRDIIESFNKIVADTGGAALYKPHIFLVDPRAWAHDFGFDGMMRIKDNVERWAKTYPGRNVKTALVLVDENHSAFGKIWQALADSNPAVGAQVHLFRTKEDAVAWLKS